jgi:hypothetical protein
VSLVQTILNAIKAVIIALILVVIPRLIGTPVEGIMCGALAVVFWRIFNIESEMGDE